MIDLTLTQSQNGIEFFDFRGQYNHLMNEKAVKTFDPNSYIYHICFFLDRIFTNLKNKPKLHILRIFTYMIFYATLIFFNHRIAVPPVVEGICAGVLLIILPIKLWCYKESR